MALAASYVRYARDAVTYQLRLGAALVSSGVLSQLTVGSTPAVAQNLQDLASILITERS